MLYADDVASERGAAPRQQTPGGSFAQVQERIVTDMEALLEKLPPRIQAPLRQRENINELLEVVLDLGREPEGRVLDESVSLGSQEVTQEDIQYVIHRVGSFW